MPFPSVLNSFNRPSPSDRLNSPSHSDLHNTVSSAVGQIEQVIGLSTTSVQGSLFYDIRSPDSNGGGHVQTANKGGTGQTTFTKGDLLVATSSSVIAKLAVSSVTGDVLVADTGQAAGMRWGAVVANKVQVTTSSVFQTSVLTTPVVLFAASIAGSTLGTNNAVKFTGLIRDMTIDDTMVTTFAVNYGNNVVASFTGTSTAISSLLGGVITGVVAGNGATNSQIGYIHMNLMTKGAVGNFITRGQEINIVSQATSSINSTANQDLTITGTWQTTANMRCSVLTGIFTVEKLV